MSQREVSKCFITTWQVFRNLNVSSSQSTSIFFFSLTTFYNRSHSSLRCLRYIYLQRNENLKSPNSSKLPEKNGCRSMGMTETFLLIYVKWWFEILFPCSSKLFGIRWICLVPRGLYSMVIYHAISHDITHYVLHSTHPHTHYVCSTSKTRRPRAVCL